MYCSICDHPQRAEIEQACLLRNFGDNEVTLRDIAIKYNVQLRDLQVHVLMHIPLEERNEEDMSSTHSLAAKIKLREADILRNTMEESYVTFKNLGAKINQIVSQHTTDDPTLQQLTKPVTDLYLGTSQSIRDTAEKLMKMDLLTNGEDNKGLTQVAELVRAIHGVPGSADGE